METVTTSLGSYAPDFELPGIDGSVHHLAKHLENHRAVAVIFMCNHCPYVKLYLDRLKQLQQEFQEQRVALIGINPNDDRAFPEDSYDNMKSFAASNQLNFRYLRDVTQEVARSFGAQKTPHVFLLNQQSIICYAGAIDDNAQNPNAVKTQYLRDAIVNLLNDQPISPASTAPVGCSIKWRNGSPELRM